MTLLPLPLFFHVIFFPKPWYSLPRFTTWYSSPTDLNKKLYRPLIKRAIVFFLIAGGKYELLEHFREGKLVKNDFRNDSKSAEKNWKKQSTHYSPPLIFFIRSKGNRSLLGAAAPLHIIHFSDTELLYCRIVSHFTNYTFYTLNYKTKYPLN